MQDQQSTTINLAPRRLRFIAAIIDAFLTSLHLFIILGLLAQITRTSVPFLWIFPIAIGAFILFLGQPFLLFVFLILMKVSDIFNLFYFLPALVSSYPFDSGSYFILYILVVIVLCLLYWAFMVVQIFFLVKKGQTIGKKIMDLRIIRLTNTLEGRSLRNRPIIFSINWVGIFLVRYVANSLICFLFSIVISIPTEFNNSKFLFGGLLLYELLDILLILLPSRRCFHDILAGTCVVKNR